MHLSIHTPLRAHDTGNKSYMYLGIRTLLRDQDTGNKSYILAGNNLFIFALKPQDTGNMSYILAFEPRLVPKTSATNRTSQQL